MGNTIIRSNDVVLDGLTTDCDIIVADAVKPNGLAINNVKARRLVIRGCAADVGEDGNMANEDWGLTVSGEFGAIRLIRPYIAADISGAKYKANSLYTAKNTSVNLGMIMN